MAPFHISVLPPRSDKSERMSIEDIAYDVYAPSRFHSTIDATNPAWLSRMVFRVSLGVFDRADGA